MSFGATTTTQTGIMATRKSKGTSAVTKSNAILPSHVKSAENSIMSLTYSCYEDASLREIKDSDAVPFDCYSFRCLKSLLPGAFRLLWVIFAPYIFFLGFSVMAAHEFFLVDSESSRSPTYWFAIDHGS